ncbi:hypothetical protein V7112_14430 [Bacillus sp. JJ1566]|uniref:hypothetical protein n=1 Tax=Bacillus sp. JJ1566 TaxID=3122961 RepID=UPI002FFF2306
MKSQRSIQAQSKKFNIYKGNGITFFVLVKQHGLEDIVLKKKDTPYWQTELFLVKGDKYQYKGVYLTRAKKKRIRNTIELS